MAPRLLLLAVLACTVRFGCDPLLEWLIVSSGQSATGAKVELADVSTWIKSGKIAAHDLQVANPKSAYRNLFQAEQIVLQLDSLALLHNRFVVTNGAITGLELDTERDTSGELDVSEVSTEEGPPLFDPLITKGSDLAYEWLENASQRLDADFAGQLQTPQVADQLAEKWKAQSKSLRNRADLLKERGKKLAEEFREIKKNPLRGAERIPQLHAELKSSQQELLALQKEIQALSQQAQTDRQALAAARQQDESFLKKQFAFDQLDGDNLTQILLGDTLAENLQEACDWITWARKKSPGNATKQLAAQRSRGTNVIFGKSCPQFELQHVGIEMSAPIAGTSMQFVGYLSGVSSAPHLLEEPTRLELAALGDNPVKLLVLSDHRGQVPREQIRLVCSALPVSGRTLGNKEKLAVELAPGAADLSVDIELEGDTLSGQIAFAQNEFQLTPLSSPGVNKHLVTALESALGSIEQVTAEVELTGTLNQPLFKINSPFGEQLANEISTAVVKLARERGEALLAKSTAKMNAQLEKLTAAKTKLEQDLLANLGDNQKLFEDLAGTAGFGGRGLSVPQISSKLGNGILRR